MAHQLRLNATTVVGIPFTVVLRVTPCLWKLEPTTYSTLDLKSGRLRRVLRHSVGFLGQETGPPGDAYIPDPWKLREVFLSLRTDQEILKFLNEVGRFAPSSSAGHSKDYWELQAFQCWRQIFSDLLKHSPATWSRDVRKLVTQGDEAESVERALNEANTFPIQFRWQGAHHSAILEAGDAVTAILATINVDHLRGAKFGFCARPDCRKAFEIISKHEREYCGQYCAHLESVRRMRKRQKQKRRKPGDQGARGHAGT